MKRVTAFLVIVFFVLTSLAPLDSWSYQTPFVIDNQSGSNQTNFWVNVRPIPVDTLINSGFMESDGSDVRIANPGETEQAAVVQDTGTATDVATWWAKIDNLQQGESTYYIHTGNSSATLDQGFGFDGTTDTVTTADHADLDITDGLALQADLTDAVYPTIISVPSGAELIWNLTEGTGLPQDVSGNGNHATIANGAWSAASLSLDLRHSRVYSPNQYDSAPDDATLDFSNGETIVIEILVEFDSFDTSHVLVGKPPLGNANYQIYMNAAAQLYFSYFDTGAATHTWRSTNSLCCAAGEATTWRHISLEYTFGTGASLNLRVDGVDEAGSYIIGNGNVAPQTNATIFRVGGDGGGGDFNGAIAYVRIWRGVRTDAERDDNIYTAFGGPVAYAELISKMEFPTDTASAGYALTLSSDGEVCLDIDLATPPDQYCEVIAAASLGDIEGVFVADPGNDMAIFNEGSQVGAGFDSDNAAVGTNSEALTSGISFTGTTDLIEVRNASTLASGSGTAQMTWDFEPNELVQTQIGDAGNSWNWLGTVEDVSAGGVDHDGNYTLTRDMSNYSITVEGLELKAVGVSLPSEEAQAADVFQDPLVTEIPATVTGYGVPIIGAWVQWAQEITDLPVQLIWLSIVTTTAVGVGFSLLVSIKEPIVSGIAVSGVYAVFASVEVVSWLLMPLYILLGIGIIAITKR